MELTEENALPLLVRFVNQAQKNGSFQLKEAALLHKSIVFLNKQGYQDDKDFTPELAKSLLFQAVNIGQTKGAFNLDDAALLDKLLTFMQTEPVQTTSSENEVTSSKLRVV